MLSRHLTHKAVHLKDGMLNAQPNQVLASWNRADVDEAAAAILPCCGSDAWARALAARRPLKDEQTLLDVSRAVWFALSEADWKQAFDSHPRIGEQKPQGTATAVALAWSTAEQSAASSAPEEIQAALREANATYEKRFGRIFLIRARGRSTNDILAQLERRLQNTSLEELQETVKEQSQITDLRLQAWLNGV